MRIALSSVAGVLLVAVLTPAAGAQPPRRPYLRPSYVSPYPAAPQGVAVAPTFTTIAIQSSLTVPDGGTASLGGYGRLSEGRTELGTPVLGRLPYAGRGSRNVGYGRSAASTRVGVRVRIIDLREEEYRQTGFRSP